MSLVIFIIIVIGVLAFPCYYLYKRFVPVLMADYKFHIGFAKVTKGGYKVKFNKSFKRLNLPLVSLKINGKSYNFILDTGADTSVFNTKDYEQLNKTGHIVGKKDFFKSASGGEVTSQEVTMPLNFEDIEMNESFYVSDIDFMMKQIQEKDGIKVVGLLGSPFFEKNKWIIDFDEMVIWVKEN